MNLSVLIPTRECAAELQTRIIAHNWLAKDASAIEWLLRVDSDDPQLDDYKALGNAIPNVSLLIGPPMGFAGHRYLDELYRVSQGRYLMSLNSDADILSKGWDEAYLKALEPIPYGVAGAEVDEGGASGENFAWCMGVVDRRICDRLGKFCSGEVVDRVFYHYARMTGRGVIAPVAIRHLFKRPAPGSVRGEFYRRIFSDVKASLAQWDAEARLMAKAVG